MKETCSNCRFWDRQGEVYTTYYGYCRKSQPGNYLTKKPHRTTMEDDWCGRWSVCAALPDQLEELTLDELKKKEEFKHDKETN